MPCVALESIRGARSATNCGSPSRCRTGLCLPLRLLTQQEAETLARTLNEYLDESEEE